LAELIFAVSIFVMNVIQPRTHTVARGVLFLGM
jgi:hypothetical protein